MISEVHAMAPRQGDAPQGLGGGFGGMIVPLLFMFVVFYFMLIRPQRKRDQAHRKFLEGLQKGAEVITNSGLYGRVAGISEQVITLEVAPNVKIRVAKSAIGGLQGTPEEGKKLPS
jgi:preprotein translocase subunit YajC